MDCRNSIARFGWMGIAMFLLCSGCIFARGSKKEAEPTPAVAPTDASADQFAKATPAELAAILTEVQQVGALDPQAQNALLEDLKRTDPALWPQLVQTFRASIAYRRQVAERAQREAQQLAQGDPRFTGQVRPAGYVQDGQQPKPLPEAVDGAVTPSAPNGEFAAGYPDTKMPPGKLIPGASDPNDWRSQLTVAIRSLQEEANSANAQSNTSLSASDQSKLRLLQLAAGQRDDALKPLTGVSGAEQEFWGEQLFGLATLLDDQRMPDSQRRAAEAAQHLREATAKLGQAASLVVRNLAFCSEVTSYGVFKPFTKYEFKPGQEVLLYAELENFASETTEKGYHTALKSSYQILDSRGARVAEQEFPVTEEVCRNSRRDFFIRYFVYMPKRIYDGNYTLQLTIEDTQGKKVGQSTIEFAIVGAD
jgi:hypothetical protein